MGEILFSAEVKPWLCIKKQKIEEGTEKIEVSRALASIHNSMDRKIWEYLKDEFPLDELDKIAYDISGAQYYEKKKKYMVKGRLSEAQIATAMAKLSNPSTTKKINEVIPKTKNGLEIAKSYISRKVLDLLGFRLELDPKIVEKYVNEKKKLGL